MVSDFTTETQQVEHAYVRRVDLYVACIIYLHKVSLYVRARSLFLYRLHRSIHHIFVLGMKNKNMLAVNIWLDAYIHIFFASCSSAHQSDIQTKFNGSAARASCRQSSVISCCMSSRRHASQSSIYFKREEKKNCRILMSSLYPPYHHIYIRAPIDGRGYI